MTRETPPKSPAPEGERIAKVLSRAGVASRREAERMIELGEVAVNGKTIDSPALNVTARDRITVRGEPLAAAEPARLWLYYKPDGLVTSASDEKGRSTVFDALPPELPRVMSVGRLDLNSEGLLLLTNDGELKRRLELPSTGWLRKYRVRIKGNPTDPDLEPLRRGITVDGEKFQPMAVTLDRHQGANAWLTVGLREGKNREIRRALAALDLTVNRLIRISYGPFRLGDLEPGQVEEVKAKTLREQLGEEPAEKPVGTAARKPRPPRPGASSDAPRAAKGTRVRRPAGTDADAADPAPATKPATRRLAPRPARSTSPAETATPATRARKPSSKAAADTAGKTAGKTAARPAAKTAGKAGATPAPKPARKTAATPALQQLSDAWTKATTPRKAAPAAKTTAPAKTSPPPRSGTRPATKSPPSPRAPKPRG